MQYDSLQQIGLSLGQQAKRSLIDHHQSKSCSLLYKYTGKNASKKSATDEWL